jgi:HEAT repeat protein
MRTLVAVLLAVGCVADPQDPKTWIKKLDDPREKDEAVIQLVKLKDAEAVPPLIELYKKTKDPNHLKAIASFKDKRALDVMVDALDFTEESCDAAKVAANALGDIPDPKAVDPLMKAVQKPLPIKTSCNVVKLEAMKSLVKIGDKRAVDVLVKVLETPADEQDFFLNQVAAQSLGKLKDPKAIPALIRGLWMVGRGAGIFQDCRAALLAMGDAPIDPLIETMQHKNAKVEADARKYEFTPGIIEQKVSILLGDLRAKKAVPLLIELVGKADPGAGKGAPVHQSALLALGLIGDPAGEKTLVAVVSNPKAPNKDRTAAAEALNALGDTAALPALLKLANENFINTKTKEIDGEKGAMVAGAATAFSRLAGAESAGTKFQKLPADLEESDAHVVFANATARLNLAKECGKDLGCYAKQFDTKDDIKAEKAAFMLARMGKPGLVELAKHVGYSDSTVRMTILFGISHYGDKTSKECMDALEKQIELDKTKPPLKGVVDEMRATLAQISARG